MVELAFPNETAHYRRARRELLEAEIGLRAEVERVAALRRQLPLGGAVAQDYAFAELSGSGRVRTVRLSQLFVDGRDSLFLYSFMYHPQEDSPCPMCSSLLDALDGNAAHIGQRVNLAVVARSPIERVAAFARDRGWGRLRMLSSHANSYHRDYFGETDDGAQVPMANVFVRRDGAIHHFWGSELFFADLDGQPRHMDLMWPLWNLFDTTPQGRGEDWYPSLET